MTKFLFPRKSVVVLKQHAVLEIALTVSSTREQEFHVRNLDRGKILETLYTTGTNQTHFSTFSVTSKLKTLL